MRKHRLRLLALTGMLILACNFPLLAPGPSNAAATETATEAPPVVLTAESLTETATTVPVSSVPMASPNGQPVNCRSGPGLFWSVTIILQPGQSAEIVAKTADGTWLEVKNPNLGGNLCWVSTGVVSTTGDLGPVAIAAGPPTPVQSPTSVVVSGNVTSVSISIKPTKISVGGCMGPIQPSTVTATITVSGPVKLHAWINTDQVGNLPSHALTFLKASSKDFSDSFTPPLTAGTYSVQLIIDGVSLKGMDAVATYKISC